MRSLSITVHHRTWFRYVSVWLRPRVPLDRVLSLGDTEALQTGDMHSAFRHFSCFIIWGAPHTRLVVGTGLNDERCGVVVQGVAVGEGAQAHEYETAQGAQARHGGCQGA